LLPALVSSEITATPATRLITAVKTLLARAAGWENGAATAIRPASAVIQAKKTSGLGVLSSSTCSSPVASSAQAAATTAYTA
jgi:hypothetical protein